LQARHGGIRGLDCRAHQADVLSMVFTATLRRRLAHAGCLIAGR
jgi:hypothetical protein